MEKYESDLSTEKGSVKTFCPYCGKPIEWVEDEYGHEKAVDPVPILFRKTEEGEKGITVISSRGEIISGITVRNPIWAWDFGQRIHYCYMAGRLRR